MPRVLLVDDEPELLRGLRLALRKEPFDVVTATSAREGLEVLEREEIDVVVSDERMPEMPGSEFLTIARERFPDVERIILTGQASMEATITAINQARVFRFLTKPCPTPELVEVINEALRAREERRAAAALLPEAGSPEAVALFEEALAACWLAFQPIAGNKPTWSLFAFEALLRSEHPALPGPGPLIESAVALGRYFDLDRAVRRRVADLIPSAPPDTLIFVNLLPQSLGDPELVGPDNPLHPFADRIVFEITERASLDEIADVEGTIARLRELGYRIAIDDLGAGYAGLTSFATLQPDVVKLDMELVRDIHDSPTRSKLVGSMVGLCRELGVLCLAEGIETDQELEHLLFLGMDLLQGYRIAKPEPPFTTIASGVGRSETPDAAA
ncbi:MAG: EAL domain-containing protein [Acidimicrobiales bacterium]|jgi:EAL domain-containing protein (putative c-di-GMP-specific phosphodiesterase class I)|nr:EAL domain-containing protein [Acidimicrobiales bacterium]